MVVKVGEVVPYFRACEFRASVPLSFWWGLKVFFSSVIISQHFHTLLQECEKGENGKMPFTSFAPFF
jgi:hypothetical protein